MTRDCPLIVYFCSYKGNGRDINPVTDGTKKVTDGTPCLL